MPTFKDRYYSAPPSTQNIAAQYIFDPTAVNTGAFPPTTGVWRAANPADFAASINVSGGLSVTIGSVGITGNPQVQISNFPSITPISGLVGLTSVPTHNVTVTGNTLITGNINVIGSTYTSNLTGITSGVFSIPVGSKSWSIAVESGSAYYNTLVLNEGTTLNGGGYDGRYTLGTSINIGCTGGRTLISWEI